MMTAVKRVLVVAPVVWGCAFNHKVGRLGHSFVVGARTELRDTATRAVIHRVLDSALVDLRTSFRSGLWPTVDSTLHTVAAFGDSTIRAAGETLATALEGRLSSALDSLVRTNLRSAGEEGRAQLTALSRQLRWELDYELGPSLEGSVRLATRTFMHELSDGLRTELKVAAESALAAVVRAGVQAGNNEVQSSSVGKKLAWIGVGLVAGLLALAVAWMVRDRRRNRTALELVLGEIARHGDAQLAAAIESRAAERRVERYVARRDLRVQR
ncbi:MAG: hypothetical protein ACREMF_02015 [Gemmatimonadales bacterium]